jgi:4-amino-4-deoxy-L-arabinose transferase-like glycosyltransferase
MGMTATVERTAVPTQQRNAAPASRHRLAIGGLLGATALLYLWGLGESGWANAYYSAAAQAGAASWKALLFGATDAASGITLDKAPASVWMMALSVKVFGLSSWNVLIPQALQGVAAVGLLYATVRRTCGHAAGLLAGAVLALTPAAALMFRFNNPDALLVLLLVAGAYATVRATSHGPRPRQQRHRHLGSRQPHPNHHRHPNHLRPSRLTGQSESFVSSSSYCIKMAPCCMLVTAP